MAALPETQAPAWSIRLAFELIGNDQTANALVAGLTDERLNSQPAPGCWSMGQCLEHVTNKVSMPPISAALEEKPDSPVEQITSGWFGRWFIRSFAEASSNGKRASPRARSGPGRVSSFRFLIDSSPAASLGANSASEPPQAREPASVLESFYPRDGRDWAGDHCQPRTPASIAGRTSPGLGELPALVESAMPFSFEQTWKKRMRIRHSVFVLVVALFLFGRETLRAQAAQERLVRIIPCSSDDGEKHYCEADTRHGARLVRQRSQAPCKEGESWGYDEEGIWVDKGCGGDFALGRGEGAGDARVVGGGKRITCASEDGKRRVCPADTSNGVQLVRQQSDAKCKEGSSWGHDAQGIWVDKGCEADFVVGVPGHPAGSEKAATKSQTISCESFDGRKNYCDADTQGAKVQLTRQIGTAPCTEGSTWGYDRRGIWVDRGCSGEFVVQAGSKPDAGDSSVKSCAKTVGKKVADELVRRCLQVSPGTQAPCNEKNSCKVMENEIQRGCELLGAKAPAFCGGNPGFIQ